MPQQALDAKLRGWLAAKKKIVLTWDCGGDETLVYGHVDKAKWEWDDKDFLTLCEIVIEKLQLPNAGEEFNKGGGNILLENGQLILRYKATYFGVTWDEEEGDIIENDPEELEGDLVLFAR